jgi:FHA domain
MTARLLNVSRRWGARVRDFFDAAPDAAAPPLELLQAALDQLERKTQPSGRGTRHFPYHRVVVHIVQPDADRPAIEAVFAQLPTRLRERLKELRCDPPPTSFEATVSFDETAPEGRGILWIDCIGSTPIAAAVIETSTNGGDEVQQLTAQPELRLTVLTGQCEQAEYAFQTRGIAIGRGAEPMDTHGRVRRNHVAFLEVRDGISETVARAHARLELDPDSRAWLLFNESSSNPTFVRRDGRNLRIAPRDPRGVRVQSGDELQLGRAVIRLAITV